MDRHDIDRVVRSFGEVAGRAKAGGLDGLEIMVHGHLIGAASALETALTVCTLQTGRIAPTANLTDPDPECDLDCVPLVGREAPGLEYALTNSFAFGGSIATLVLRKVLAS